jgi:hypothetical protein
MLTKRSLTAVIEDIDTLLHSIQPPTTAMGQVAMEVIDNDLKGSAEIKYLISALTESMYGSVRSSVRARAILETLIVSDMPVIEIGDEILKKI